MKIKINLSINKAVQILLIYIFLVIMGASLFSPIFAVFITGNVLGATLKTAGFAIAIYAITKAIIQIPLARKIDRYDGEKDDFFVLIAGAIIGIIFPFSMLVISKPFQLYLLEFLAGIGDACLMAAYYGIFARHVDKGSEGFEWSLFSAFGLTISTAVGGALGGIFADAYGFRYLFLTSGILNVFAAALLFLLYPYIRKYHRENLKKAVVNVEVLPVGIKKS